MDLIFNWNPTKAEQDVAKHGVKFSEALTAFSDPLARIFDDHDHSGDEHRELLVGRSSSKRLLVVCFVERGGLIRLISARRATPREIRDYEQKP